MGKPGRKSERDCKSIASNGPGERQDATTVIHSISLPNGENFGYATSTGLLPLTEWCWTISTVLNALRLRADEYPCIP